MANNNWSKLNKHQLGRYAEIYALMEFLSYGIDVYPSEVDDHGVDLVIKDRNMRFSEIQIKSLYKSKYTYVKEKQIQKCKNYHVCLILFFDGENPHIYLIPISAWKDTSTKLFTIRNYKSGIEYGINISKKNMTQLEEYSFDKTIKNF